MKKDPAVLFYTKDWLEGTVDMFPEEKGVYIDLLCYQHQKGFLPQNERRLAKITGISEEKFTKIWQEIRGKFIAIESLAPSLSEPLTEWQHKMCSDGFGEGLVNFRMLTETVTRRKTTTKKSIQAYVTNWFRYDPLGKTIKKSQKLMLLKKIDYKNLMAQNSGKKEIYLHLQALAQRFAEQLHIVNGNGDGNANNTINFINSSANENEDANAKKNVAASKKIVDVNFQTQLCDFFSMTGKNHLQVVEQTLQKLSLEENYREFKNQTTAYMQYKTLSAERRHLWEGYLDQWQKTDWKHKLEQFSSEKKPMKKKFSINR
ncbi:DUF1376 domain-containing protein [Aquimarina sp. RZ0]|uniref:DUF1376 domain-containing protein n=1 Tax=Aquimarina sp. RZ0 TaxID=2607730 RepID=UPI0011F1823D|nr:DUF1376 domain-containing protein [Aquimarina sp. RZ0]KAA1244515.1 DUF1376 domain-containing protein [Aquimarina sp. RZ0]